MHRAFFSVPQDKAEDKADTQNKPFQVKIASSGTVLDVNENQTITQVLAQNGIFVPVSCGEGVCGTCLTNVLAREADHHDVYLSKQERQDENGFCRVVHAPSLKY